MPELKFAYALGEPTARGIFRLKHEDFIVEESLGFTPSGEGEHLFVHIKKRGENTVWVAEKLAAYFGVKAMDVGFCGMKDRHAVTSQWFSVYLPGHSEPVNWDDFVAKYALNVEVLDSAYHNKKLRRGEHQNNMFTIRLRELADVSALEPRLASIREKGVPNYFGEQRFGRDGHNLVLAQDWVASKQKIKNRNKRSIVMSAARSYLFNLSLSARVSADNWRSLLEGDISPDQYPTGSLWGRGRCEMSGQASAIEETAVAAYVSWRDQLEHVGLNQERRTFVLSPIDFAWEQQEEDLILTFGLLPGQYATAVLRELCILDNQTT